MSNKYFIAIAGFFIVIIPLSYFYYFSFFLGYPISKDQGVWGTLGDFLGGVLNPILSFITIFLLKKSLDHQSDANEELTKQLQNNIENENLRTFENIFFNLISLQKEIYSRFKINIIENNKKNTIYQEDAVRKIEDTLYNMFQNNLPLSEIIDLYEDLDDEYNLYDVLRSFSTIVRLIDEKLEDEIDRESYYKRLISLTDFANLRLVCAATQFEESENANYLKNNREFNNLVKKVNLSFNLYEYPNNNI